MIEKPLISVIIPCFNYGNFLHEAVQSVLFQSYAHLECLVIDDGSADNTPQLGRELETADGRVKYHRKSNGGLSSARNYGIDNAKGEFICFLDADDLFHREKLEGQLRCFVNCPETDI